MTDFLIDRSLFQRILERYFELEIENQAYRTMMTRGAKEKPGPAYEYSRLYSQEIAVHKTRFGETPQILADKLAGGDDAAARKTLAGLFPPR